MAASALALTACSVTYAPGGDERKASAQDAEGGSAPEVGGAGGAGGEGGGESSEVACVDACPAPNGGITLGCEKRFMYGVNYAWRHFGGDFGGIAAQSRGGVAAEAESHAARLADLRAHGASVVRWWMLPEFRGESVAFDAADDPVGLGDRTLGDVQRALELAEQADVNLIFCLFSYDAFHPTRIDAGVRVVGVTPLVTDAARRARLIDNVVKPIARAVEQSPFGHRMVAWDVINEPERAIVGPSPYGDPDYAPDAAVRPVSHGEMEAFLRETISALRSESRALITIGAASMQWSRAWANTDVDFYTFHINNGVNRYWPYNQSPQRYGVADKPVVMGDFPLSGLNTATLPEMLESWYSQGYAGAIGWADNGTARADLETFKAFADTKGCEIRY